MKNITLAAFALCATQTVACMAPTDEELGAEAVDDASELYWADGSADSCSSEFRGEFERHDDGMGAHIAWKDNCTGSELVLWIESAEPEQPLAGAAVVVGFIETRDGLLGQVDGVIQVHEDAPDYGRMDLAVGRSGVDIGEIEAAIDFVHPLGQPGRVDGALKLY